MKSTASGIRAGTADLGDAIRVTQVVSKAYFACHGTHAQRCLAAARALIREATAPNVDGGPRFTDTR